jgi:hypothetical protein
MAVTAYAAYVDDEKSSSTSCPSPASTTSHAAARTMALKLDFSSMPSHQPKQEARGQLRGP